MARESVAYANPELVNGSETALHSHAGGGGANIKSGTKVASTGSNSVTFNTAFASTPRITLTVQDSINLRDCLYQVTEVSTTGFSFEVDGAATYAWTATDAGDS